MSDLEFVDTHIHFHDLQNPDLRYVQYDAGFVHPQIGEQFAKLAESNYVLEEYIAETRSANVTKAVHVQAALARIHRRTALGTALEEARGCSSESGIMVLEQKPARKQGAPNRCCHRTIPTVSASSLTTTAWWPMPGGQCRPAPAGHPRPAPGPARTRRPSP